MMTSEGIVSSAASMSAEHDKSRLSDTSVHSENSSEGLSPVPSYVSMKSSQSMHTPNKFSNRSGDEDSTDQRDSYIPTNSRTNTAKRQKRQGKKEANCNFWLWAVHIVVLGACAVVVMPIFREEPEAELEMRLSLVGKTGVGKSAAGNIILGRRAFEEKFSVLPVTKQCQSESAVVAGKRLIITDMPAVGKLKADYQITKCDVSEMVTHAFLLVIRLGRIAEEERETVENIKEVFGEQALKHTLVLFTGGDSLGGNPIFDLLDQSPVLREIVAACGGRYHVFNNKDWSDRQVKVLLEKIETMLYMNSAYYINNKRMNVIGVSEDGRGEVSEDGRGEVSEDGRGEVSEDGRGEHKQNDKEGYGFLNATYLMLIFTLFLLAIFLCRRSVNPNYRKDRNYSKKTLPQL